MPDSDLCTAVTAVYPALTAFERQIVALARLRIMRGEPLKPHQRHTLQHLLEAQTLPPPAKEPQP